MRLQGAGRHALADRGNDLYETPEQATRALIRAARLPSCIWEPCAGRGAIKRVFEAHGFSVHASDLAAYPGADAGIQTGTDFLFERSAPTPDCAIVTNPPYRLADAMIRHGLSLGVPFFALLRLAALEGAKRSDLIDGHLVEMWAGIERLPFMHREGWDGPKQGNSGAPFAWFHFSPTPRPDGAPIALHRISWRSASTGAFQ